MPSSKSHPIVVKLPSSASSAQPLSAYVVDSGGKITETAAFSASTARLKTTGDALKRSRLFVGPEFPSKYSASKVDVFALVSAGAYQVSASVGGNNEISITSLPSSITTAHFPQLCQVQGNVNNTATINGIPQSSPVCTAKVHICTVDWYFRWPFWLRPVIPAAVVDALKTSVTNLRTNPVSAARRAIKSSSSATSAAVSLEALPANVESDIMAATPDTIQEIVFNHSALLFPYFCIWPLFWPWFYRVVEQEVVYTDCNGHFDGLLVWFGGTPIDENVYVWVEASIGGQWVSVYRPPFPCNTYWHYACGTEINISLANAAIPPCNCAVPVTDGTVWFTGIGAYGIASSIQQDVKSKYTDPNSVVGPIANVGCTNFFDSNQLSPFGSMLNLYLAFGQTLPPATHYRWSWSYILNSAGNPISQAPTNITGAVGRDYLWQKADGSWEGGSVPLLDTDTNGAVAYSIPAYEATAYSSTLGVPANAEWTSFNFISASLDSTKLFDGYVIQLNLELLNKNGGVFESVSVPVKTFQVSVDTDYMDGSTPAPYMANGSGNNYLTLDPAISGNALNFCLKVRVDNSAVTAHINPASLLDSTGDSIEGNACGVIEFTNAASESVVLSFVASGALNFATFDYSVAVGGSGSTAGLPSASGYVFDNITPFTLSGPGGTYSDTAPLTTVLQKCPSAAFAETLTVASLATDGSIRLSETGGVYYASAVNAFALVPST